VRRCGATRWAFWRSSVPQFGENLVLPDSSTGKDAVQLTMSTTVLATRDRGFAVADDSDAHRHRKSPPPG